MNSTPAHVRKLPFASLRRYEPGQVPRVLLSGPREWPRPERMMKSMPAARHGNLQIDVMRAIIPAI